MRALRTILIAALAMLLLSVCGTAGASEFCLFRAEEETDVTTACSYVAVAVELAAPGEVSITVADGESVVYQRVWQAHAGLVTSDYIYLPLNGGTTRYLMYLATPEKEYTIGITRVQPRLKQNAACTAGYPLAWLNGAHTWATVTLLDLEEVAREPVTVPLYASVYLEVGQVTFSLEGDVLHAEAMLYEELSGQIEQAAFSAALTAAEAELLGTDRSSVPRATLEEGVRVGRQGVAAVYVEALVSFDPAACEELWNTTLDGQEELWRRLRAGE